LADLALAGAITDLLGFSIHPPRFLVQPTTGLCLVVFPLTMADPAQGFSKSQFSMLANRALVPPDDTHRSYEAILPPWLSPFAGKRAHNKSELPPQKRARSADPANRHSVENILPPLDTRFAQLRPECQRGPVSSSSAPSLSNRRSPPPSPIEQHFSPACATHVTSHSRINTQNQIDVYTNSPADDRHSHYGYQRRNDQHQLVAPSLAVHSVYPFTSHIAHHDHSSSELNLNHLPHNQVQVYADLKKRIDLIRVHEITKLEVSACTAVKMNLRGRTRLEHWLRTASQETRRAVTFIAATFQMDDGITSALPSERSRAMLNMTNDKLRLCDALMKRVTTRDGRFKWTLMFHLADCLQDLQDPERAIRLRCISSAIIEQNAKLASVKPW
jgi:hypothetical protein